MNAHVAAVFERRERWHIEHASCLDFLASLPSASVDAIVTDPPYGLGGREPTVDELVAYIRGAELDTGGDFMGKKWSVPSVSVWLQCLRVLKPGGYLVAFGGSRTIDLIGLGLRAAGFQIRDGLEWLYGSGFPKSLNVANEIDSLMGVEPTIVGSRTLTGTAALSTAEKGGTFSAGISGAGKSVEVPIKEPTSDEAKAWKGFGTALKPAHEPIILARKPLTQTVARNVLEHGTGALNVHACRLGAAADKTPAPKRRGESEPWFTNADAENLGGDDTVGRWPPNVILTHDARCRRLGSAAVPRDIIQVTGDLDRPVTFGGGGGSKRLGSMLESVGVYTCVDGCPVRELDRQSGESQSGGNFMRPPSQLWSGKGGGLDETQAARGFDDAGGASRFFPTFEWNPELDTFRFLYEPKCSRSERERGCAELRAHTAGEATGGRKEGSDGLKSPRAGAGRTSKIGVRNIHPTVKPVAVMRWLCKLVTPPGGVIVDPYTGSGTTAIAAMLEGFRFLGSERSNTEAEPFVAIARNRVAWVIGGHYEAPAPGLAQAQPSAANAEQRQLSLFKVSA